MRADTWCWCLFVKVALAYPVVRLRPTPSMWSLSYSLMPRSTCTLLDIPSFRSSLSSNNYLLISVLFFMRTWGITTDQEYLKWVLRDFSFAVALRRLHLAVGSGSLCWHTFLLYQAIFFSFVIQYGITLSKEITNRDRVQEECHLLYHSLCLIRSRVPRLPPSIFFFVLSWYEQPPSLPGTDIESYPREDCWEIHPGYALQVHIWVLPGKSWISMFFFSPNGTKEEKRKERRPIM